MTTSPPARTTPPPAPAAQPVSGTVPRGADRGPLRITWREPGRGVPLEGAWHPYSRDLAVELADLVDRFPGDAGRPARLLYSRPDWDLEPGVRGPRRITAARGSVKVGSFPHDDTHLVTVRTSLDRALRLLVVPSEVDEERGRRILERAAAPDNTHGADELLAAEG